MTPQVKGLVSPTISSIFQFVIVNFRNDLFRIVGEATKQVGPDL